MPSRLATDSRARTRASSIPTRIALIVRPSIALGMAYSDRVAAAGSSGMRTKRSPGVGPDQSPGVVSARIDRAAPALGIPLPAVQPAPLSGPLHADLGRLARPADRPRRPLQRPDQGPPPSCPVPRPLRVAPVDRPDVLRLDADGVALRVRPDPRHHHRGDRARHARLGPLHPLPADPRRL